jgi:hypothetical protein
MPAIAVGHGHDRGPGGDPANVFVLPDASLSQVRRQDAREEVPEPLDPVDDAEQVVVDVAEVRAHFRRDELVPTAGQVVERVQQGRDRVVELEDLPLELVDSLGRVAAGGREHFALQIANGLVEAGNDWRVVVDHAVHDGVEDGAGGPPAGGPAASRSPA